MEHVTTPQTSLVGGISHNKNSADISLSRYYWLYCFPWRNSVERPSQVSAMFAVAVIPNDQNVCRWLLIWPPPSTKANQQLTPTSRSITYIYSAIVRFGCACHLAGLAFLRKANWYKATASVLVMNNYDDNIIVMGWKIRHATSVGKLPLTVFCINRLRAERKRKGIVYWLERRTYMSS